MKNVFFACALTLMLIGAGCGASTQSDSSTSQAPAGSDNRTYAMTDIQTANTPEKCWTAINGKVYDLTSYISRHPGGPDNIARLCGTDGSAAFNAQHGGQRRPAQELASLQIGVLQ
jgi:cytochrome b involved in lipid metabolism